MRKVCIEVEVEFAGVTDVVKCYFNRLCPFPEKAYGEYLATVSELAAQREAEEKDLPRTTTTQQDGSVVVDVEVPPSLLRKRHGQFVAALATLFDASCLEVTCEEEPVPLEHVAGDTKAYVVQALERQWATRVKAPGQPSNGTSAS